MQMEDKIKIKRRHHMICLDDAMKSGLDIIEFEDDSFDVDLVGNKCGVITSLMHSAENKLPEAIEIKNILGKIADCNLERFQGKINTVCVAGTPEEILERLLEDVERNYDGFVTLFQNINEDQLINLLKNIKEREDFSRKNDILSIGTTILMSKMVNKTKGNC